MKKLLFYGPAGSGKTDLALGTYNEFKHQKWKQFSLNLFNLVGISSIDSQKFLKGLFYLARQQRPSVIILDNIHYFDKRLNLDLIERLLHEIQGEKKDNNNILLIVVTSKPWDLDPKLLAIFNKKVYIKLPFESQRTEILI